MPERYEEELIAGSTHNTYLKLCQHCNPLPLQDLILSLSQNSARVGRE